MKKEIQIEVEGDYLRIVKQTHRGPDFAPPYGNFKTDAGVICSRWEPDDNGRRFEDSWCLKHRDHYDSKLTPDQKRNMKEHFKFIHLWDETLVLKDGRYHSYWGPEWPLESDIPVLYVRATCKDWDDEKVRIPDTKWLLAIQKVIANYNYTWDCVERIRQGKAPLY